MLHPYAEFPDAAVRQSPATVALAGRVTALESGPGLIELFQRAAATMPADAEQADSPPPAAVDVHAMAMLGVLSGNPAAVAPAEQAAAEAPTAARWRLLGHALTIADRSDAAAEAYRRAACLAPTDALTWRACGLADYAGGRLGPAVRTFRRSLRCDPAMEELHRNLARTLWALHDLDRAAARYAVVLAIEPSHGEAWRNRGQVLFAAGRAGEALATFTRAAVVDPALRDLDYLLGCAFYRLGRTAEAAARFTAALRDVDPPPVHAVVALRSVTGAVVGVTRGAGHADGLTRHLAPVDFPTFFAMTPGMRVEHRPSSPIPPAAGFGAAAQQSARDDAAFAARGLFLARDADVTVWHGAGSFSSYLVTGDHYLATKVHERPNQTRSSRPVYFPPDADNAMPDWLLDLAGCRDLTVDDPCLYLGGTANYGHFLIDILAKLWVADVFGVNPALPVLLFPQTGIFSEITEFFFPDRRTIDLVELHGTGDALIRLRRATVPSNPSNHFTHAAIRAAVERRLGPSRCPPWRKVYLSRRNYRPHRHRVANEEEVAAFLASLGFEIIEPESLSFTETIDLFRSTRLFVSPCGAQNINMCFSHPGTVYLELGASYHRERRSWFVNDCLACYGNVLYLRHYGETVYVAPGGHDSNWLSYHPIDELRQLVTALMASHR